MTFIILTVYWAAKERQFLNHILYINACIKDNSRTNTLAAEVLKYLQGTIFELNLAKEGIKYLDKNTLEHREQCIAEKYFSSPDFKYAKQFADADIIVLAAPYWDLSFPAIVKIYIELVSVCGITFLYKTDGVPKGLCRAKKLIYVTTAGGVIGKYNFGFDYIEALAKNLYGIEKVLFFKAEGLDVYQSDVNAIIQEACKKIQYAFE